MKIEFIASFSVISPDPQHSRKLYVEQLGLPLEAADEDDDYYFSSDVGGSKHFGVWPLAQAAQSCFGTAEWPAGRPVPQASIEFEVPDAASVESAAAELVAAGHTLLHRSKTEPWGQTVARVQTSEGLILGLSYAPWMHD